MSRASRVALVVAGLLVAGLAPPGWTATGPVELPAPELGLTAEPIPLEVARPLVEAPAPRPALRFRVVDLGTPPLPGFRSTITKPFPPVDDPGTLSCGLALLGHGAASLMRCGIARVLRGELPRAREALEESLRVEPDGKSAATASLWLAELSLRGGSDADAQSLYQAALDRGLPRELAASASLGIAWIALRRGDLARADEAIREAIAPALPAPLWPMARFVDGVTRLLLGRTAEAQGQLESLERDGMPAELAAESSFWKAAILVQLGETQAAKLALDRFRQGVRTDHPLYAASLAQGGWAQLVRGMAELARRDFLAAEAAHPDPALALQLDAGLARAHLILGQYAEARERTRRLARGQGEGPLVERLLLQAAEEALRRGATTEAIETYRQLRERQLEPARRAYVSYRIAESLERLARDTNDPTRLQEAAKEFQRLRDEGGDEGLVQRATYWLAVRALQTGQPAVALREGEGLLQAGVVPEFRADVLILSASAAAQAGDPNRAATLYRLALAEGPSAPRAPELRLALGWALLEDGDAEAGLQQWRRETGPESPVRAAAYAAIARVSLQQGHENEAAEALRALAALAPPTPPRGSIVANQGILRLRAGDLAGAIETLTPLLSERLAGPAEAAVRHALGIAWYRRARYREAMEMFAEATQREPGEASNWLGLGLAALAQGRPDDADRALTRARLATDPALATTAAYALVLARRDDPKEFERRAQLFINAYPTHPYVGDLMEKLVADALARGQGEQAYAWVKSLLLRQPASRYVEDALVRLSEGEFPRPALAFEVYGDIARQVHDRDARLRARFGLAQAAVQLGRAADAQDALTGFLGEARADDPRVPWALLREGELLMRAQQWDEARVALETARASGVPTVAPEAHVRLGDLHRSRADQGAAIEDYLGAAYLYPQSPFAAVGLQGAARVYLERKMTREARIVLEKLARRPGTDPQLTRWAKDELVRLSPAAPPAPSRPRATGAQTRP